MSIKHNNIISVRAQFSTYTYIYIAKPIITYMY